MNAVVASTLTSPHSTLDMFQRAHTGRWPIFHAYSTRRAGDRIYEVARWLRMCTDKQYCVVTWNLPDGCVQWLNFHLLADARRYVRSLS